MKKPRGRPKEYNEHSVLQAAAEVFWEKGFSATSLDDLAAAMMMNRPSIYRAFGDKEAIYRKALAQFCQGLDVAFSETMLAEGEIKIALAHFYRAALNVYTSGGAPRGCMVMSTAVTAATCHPEIQSDLFNIIQGIDKKIELRFKQAQLAGQVSKSFDVANRAMLAQAVLHSLSLRARAGEQSSQLEGLINSGVEMILS